MTNFLKSLKIKGVEIDPSGAATNQILSYNGTKFVPANGATITATDLVAQGRLTGDTSVTPNSDLVIPFVDDFDPQGWWDATSKRFTPTIAGYYNVTLQVWWTIAAVTNNQNNIQIRKSGSTVVISQTQTLSGNGYSQNATKLVYLNGSTDYVDFTAYTGNSSAQSLQWGGNSNGQGTFFSAALMTAGKGEKGDTGATGATGPSGATTLDGLTDVTAPSPSNGDFLKWNGSAWVNDAIDLATDTTGSYVASLVAGTGITLTNNSGEAATPTVALTNSAVTVNGTSISLGSSGTVTAAAGTLTGTSLNSTVTGSSLTSVGSLTGLTVAGTSTVQQIREKVTDSSISTNVMTCDYSTGSIFYQSTNPSANFTVNITNAPTDNGYALTISIFVVQGATGYIPSALQVAGSAQTILWAGGTAPTPTSTSGKIDLFTFTLIRRSSAWTVLGSANLKY